MKTVTLTSAIVGISALLLATVTLPANAAPGADSITDCQVSFDGQPQEEVTIYQDDPTRLVSITYTAGKTHFFFDFSDFTGSTYTGRDQMSDYTPMEFVWRDPGDTDGHDIWLFFPVDVSGAKVGTEPLCAIRITNAPADAGEGSTVATKSNYFVVQGFNKGKSQLKKPMKKFIRKEITSRSKESRVVCTGTVVGKKWTAKKETLALARAKAGCDYVNELRPDVPVELKKRLIKKGKGDPLTVRIRVFYPIRTTTELQAV